jgi:hypothetical protein
VKFALLAQEWKQLKNSSFVEEFLRENNFTFVLQIPHKTNGAGMRSSHTCPYLFIQFLLSTSRKMINVTKAFY